MTIQEVKTRMASVHLFQARTKALIVLVVLVLGASMIFPTQKVTAEGPEPIQVVRNLNQVLIQAMKKAEELGFQGRYDLLETVIKESFSLQFMLRTTLGSHWDAVSVEQRDRLLDLYTRWSVATYASRFDSYNEQDFEIKGKDSSSRWIFVDSAMYTQEEETVLFRYVFSPVTKGWKILDIKIKGVSQLALHRSQMNAVIKREGLDGLEQALKEKIEALSRENGAVSPAIDAHDDLSSNS